MQRCIALLFAAVLLTACRPIDMPPLPTPTPDPYYAYAAAYEEFQAAFNALSTHLDAGKFDDTEWCDETVHLAIAARKATEKIQGLESPQFGKWPDAWPLIQEAMGEYHYAAGAAQNAAEQGNGWLTLPARERVMNGTNLLWEANRLLEGD